MEEQKLKVLWQSNAPWAPSGYGGQTDLFTRKMLEEGHEVVIAAHYGLHGSVLSPEAKLKILPSGFHAYGEDLMAAHQTMHKPDIYICLQDVWVLGAENIKNANAVMWCPIDHSPITPSVKSRLHYARGVWAMSQFGLKEMHNAGIFADYVPHGVDTEVFKPIDRAEARQKIKAEDDTFVVAMVASNKGFPNRKSIPEVIKAWAAFVRKYPKSVLYLHTFPFDTPGSQGLHIPQLMEFYGLSDEHVKLPDEYNFLMNQYSPQMLNNLYNAADVFLLPSMGEGFGIPVIEAQAAGCPVIVTDFSAQTELCGSGWKLAVDPFDDLEFTLQSSEQARVRPSLICKGLESAYQAKGDQSLRDAAREFGMLYDSKLVWEQHMKPAILRMARNRAEEAKRKDARIELQSAIVDERMAETLIVAPKEMADTQKIPDLAGDSEKIEKGYEWKCAHCGKISTEPTAAGSELVNGSFCSAICAYHAEKLALKDGETL
jgi:glycosyltransferase involved in cell wall biosynthesis